MSYTPTHVCIAIQRARELISKGKNGTNDAFVTIALGKDKFQTTIKDKSIDPEWYEECDILLPDKYTESSLTIQIYHRNNISIDEFLGHVEIPLNNFDPYDPPRNTWYQLACKPGQHKTKPRGEIEIRLSFEVKKVKDYDTLSTASGVSKRFKMSKKNVKHVASALGRKIKGKQVERTSDYVPDLTGLDEGALDMSDIAENYAQPAVTKKKDPSFPHSPILKTRHNITLSPGTKKTGRRPKSGVDGNEISADDSHSPEPVTFRTHRRVGSGSDQTVTGKPPKQNRRLLTSKIYSQSTVDISKTHHEFDKNRDDLNLTTGARSRTVTASSNEGFGDKDSLRGSNRSYGSHSRLSSKAKDVVEVPVLIDDSEESDIDDAFTSGAKLSIIGNEPKQNNIFARAAAKMEEEEANPFQLVKRAAPEDGEVAVLPPSKPIDLDSGNNSEVDVSITPEMEITKTSPTPKKKHSAEKKTSQKPEEKKVAASPTPDLFAMLMASDGPEYSVDDTIDAVDPSIDAPVNEPNSLIDQSKEPKQAEVKKPEEPKKVAVKQSQVQITLSSSKAEEKSSKKYKEPQSSNPFGTVVSPVKEVTNPFEEPKISNSFEDAKRSATANPFEKRSEIDKNSFEEKSVAPSNPFEDKQPEPSNPFSEPVEPATSNPFEDKRSEPSNPFGEPAESVTSNPFEEPAEKTSNPFEEEENLSAGANPFEDDDDDLTDSSTSAFNRAGSFTRAGSNRFQSNSRNKRKPKTKTSAPLPPVLKPEEKSNPAEPSQVEITPKPISYSPKFIPKSASPKSSPKSTKTKKAPPAPFKIDNEPIKPITSTLQSEVQRGRSNSDKIYVTPPAKPQRSFQDVSYNGTQSTPSPISEASVTSSTPSVVLPTKEREPTIGAESPAPIHLTERREMSDKGVQVDQEGGEHVSAEFRNMSKSELVNMIQRLRVQSRKNDELIKDQQEYIDTLLVRVMTTDPNLLASCGQQAGQVNKL